MRKIMILVLVLSVASLMYAFAGDNKEEAWFDMKNCEMCASFMETPDLMANMSMEHLNISNGMMCVTSAKPEHLEAFRKAMTSMDEKAAKMMAGEEMKLCNACKSMGSLMAQGATMEKVETANGMVSLMTSDKPEVVTMIHEWNDKTNAAMKKMHEHMVDAKE